jgi:hypothetical protein
LHSYSHACVSVGSSKNHWHNSHGHVTQYNIRFFNVNMSLLLFPVEQLERNCNKVLNLLCMCVQFHKYC